MNVSWSPLKFVLEEADEARLQGDNYKAEALINIAYDILDKQVMPYRHNMPSTYSSDSYSFEV
jgi:hypothetical protein